MSSNNNKEVNELIEKIDENINELVNDSKVKRSEIDAVKVS
jgi:hypothetical protein